ALARPVRAWAETGPARRPRPGVGPRRRSRARRTVTWGGGRWDGGPGTRNRVRMALSWRAHASEGHDRHEASAGPHQGTVSSPGRDALRDAGGHAPGDAYRAGVVAARGDARSVDVYRARQGCRRAAGGGRAPQPHVAHAL